MSMPNPMGYSFAASENDTSDASLQESWPDMDTINPENRGPRLLIVTTLCTTLATATVALRVYTRAKITRYMGWDDWLILCAMLCSFGLYAIQITGWQTGLYFHVWDVSPSDFIEAKRVGLAGQSLYPWILGFIKVSILFFYLRLSASPTFRRIVWIFIGVMSFYTVAASMAILFQCWPFNTRLATSGSTCVDFLALNYTIATLNITTDVLVYLLSWVMCRDLRVPTGQKIAVLAIFSVGALVCVFSGLRFYYLRDYWNSSDPTWVAFHVSIMSSLEANVGIVTASVPAIKPLVTRWFPSWKFLRTVCESTSGGGGGRSTIQDPEKLWSDNSGNLDSLTTAVEHDTSGVTTSTVGSDKNNNNSNARPSNHIKFSEEDLGFPGGFDRELVAPSENDLSTGFSPIINSRQGQPPTQSADSLDWIDREINFATSDRNIESFKKGNQNTTIGLVDALRGGPVGIIPDPPGMSRRASEAVQFKHY